MELLVLRDPSLIRPRAEVEERSERQILLDGLTDRLSGVADDRVRAMIGQYVQDLAGIADQYPWTEGESEEQQDDNALAMLSLSHRGQGYLTISRTFGWSFVVPDDTTLDVLDHIRIGFSRIAQAEVGGNSGDQAPQGTV